VCMAHPGTLPVINKKAVESVIKVGLALGSNIANFTEFDRKNYFYPDIPKGYQISQYKYPIVSGGKLKGVDITRVHLEEDTATSKHDRGDYSLVDFNRAGVPLMELVTEPDIENGEQARLFCTKLQQICRYLEISDADMEKGNMRCEVNLSLHKKGEDKLSGTKVEVKNINSFKFVEKAINYEIERQSDLLEKGEKVVQETRGWDSVKSITVSQRKKESAHDYRYFPEPDIPPMEFTKAYVENLKCKLPELPDAKEKRFASEYGLNEADVLVLTAQNDLAEYFEQVIGEAKEKISSHEVESSEEKVIKLATNYIISELRKHLLENNHNIKDIKISPENYAEFVGIVADGKINSSAAQTVLKEMYHTGGDPSQIIEEKNLGQMQDSSEIESAVESVIAANAKSVEDYKAGKHNALQFLMGQVMSATKSKANPKIVMDLLRKKLG